MSKISLEERKARAAALVAAKPATSHMHLYAKIDEINAARAAAGLKPLRYSWQRDGRHVYGPDSQVPIEYLPNAQARLVIELTDVQAKAEYDASYLEALADRLESRLK